MYRCWRIKFDEPKAKMVFNTPTQKDAVRLAKNCNENPEKDIAYVF